MSMRTATEPGVATYGGDKYPKAGFTVDGSGNVVVSDSTGAARGTFTTSGAAFSGVLTTTNGIVGGAASRAGGVASCLVVAGTAVTNSTAEAVSASATLPANTIGVGSVIKVRVQGIATATNSTDTLTFRLRIGGTTLTGTAVLAGSAVDVANNSFCVGDFVLVGREAAAAAAACVGSGWLSNFGTSLSGTAATTQMLGSTNFATNAPLLVEATLQWSVANAGNSARIDQLLVEIY